MTKFIGGPADGNSLALRHKVKLLRVTECKGVFDALDAPADFPQPFETLHAYRLTNDMGTAHINMGRKGSGFYPICEYTFIEPQPEQEIMRSQSAWLKWCEEQH